MLEAQRSVGRAHALLAQWPQTEECLLRPGAPTVHNLRRRGGLRPRRRVREIAGKGCLACSM